MSQSRGSTDGEGQREGQREGKGDGQKEGKGEPHEPGPFWRRDIHEDRRPFLLARNRIKTALRQWFEDQGFVEVETGCLQVSPGNETHLHAFQTRLLAPDGTSSPLYLHTSPEFACKKLLAAGEAKIFTFAPVFRNRERGPLHAPEFTMLEWYRVGESHEQLMEDCLAIARLAAATTASPTLRHKNLSVDPALVPERISLAQAFSIHAGIDLLATLRIDNGDCCTDREGLARAAQAARIRVAGDDSWSDIFSRVLVERVEPMIGRDRIAILHDYPLPEAALARPSPNDPRVAERFEMFACGVELANGFGELTDPVVQRARFEAEMAAKRAIYGEDYPIDEDFIAALGNMPDASGCAMGFERLVMLATGADRIDQVIWTPLPQGCLEAATGQ